MGTGVLTFHGGRGGLGGESHSFFESDLVSDDECEGRVWSQRLKPLRKVRYGVERRKGISRGNCGWESR